MPERVARTTTRLSVGDPPNIFSPLAGDQLVGAVVALAREVGGWQ